MKTLNTTVFTHDIAAQILDNFEDVLSDQDIVLTSPEDNEKEPDNTAAIYGSTYSDLLDNVENILIDMLEQAGVDSSKYKAYEFSGTY